jgi:hypothetical protein
LDKSWKFFEWIGFLGQVQRRGTHVNIPELGSRVGAFCFGGILRVHADLRREFWWGDLGLGFFEDLLGDPRSSIEEGGPTFDFWGASL